MENNNISFINFLANISYQAEKVLKIRKIVLVIFGIGSTCLLYKLKKSTYKWK